MRRTDCIARQLIALVLQKIIEKIGCLECTVEESLLACGTPMYDTGSHQMSQIIGFEVETAGKGSFLIFSSYCDTDFGFIFPVFESMRIDALMALIYHHRGMDITIGTLCLSYFGNKAIHQGI
ncbi:Uncharacterised protein [Segatella copri]|nr:Uncharacterised protein [Segatella copri]